MHELGHVIGFHHEHQRIDRDDFIKINYENLDGSQAASNSYIKIKAPYLNDFGVGYDYASVMHYGKDAFAKRNLDAFKVKKDLPECLVEIGQANKLYNCSKRPIPSLCELLSSNLNRKNIKTG